MVLYLSSNGFSYIFTCVDRYTRWPVSTPIRDISAETVAKSFIESWVSNFGSPATITTDHGCQFTSALLGEIRNLLGSDHCTTTAYHPASNGLVERFHRHLKASIMSRDSVHWTKQLPLILLGIRNTVKEDLGCTPADLVFGTTLRLPGEMIVDSQVIGELDPLSFASRLKSLMRQVRQPDTRQSHRPSQLHKELFTCPYVFVRVDTVRKPLRPIFDEPFKVIKRREKDFVIDWHGQHDSVSIDRLKVAFVDPIEISTPTPPAVSTPVSPTTPLSKNNAPSKSTPPVLPNKQTRFGRLPKAPSYFSDYEP